MKNTRNKRKVLRKKDIKMKKISKSANQENVSSIGNNLKMNSKPMKMKTRMTKLSIINQNQNIRKKPSTITTKKKMEEMKKPMKITKKINHNVGEDEVGVTTSTITKDKEAEVEDSETTVEASEEKTSLMVTRSAT